MQIQIIAIGKLSKEFTSLASHYIKMVKWPIKNTEITYSKKLPAGQIKQFEATLIEKYLGAHSYKILLDVDGCMLSSHKFSKFFQNQMMEGRNIDFIISGTFGVDKVISKLVDYKLSLSFMTLPHQLAKIFLIEQIYRSQTIINGHPYHK